MKKRIIMVLAAIIVSSLIYWWWQAKAHRESLDHLTLYGNTDIREVQLAFNGSEHLGEILVVEGDSVRKGQLLARLHTARLEAAVARDRALLAAQQQVVARLEAGSRPEEIRQGRAELEAARARAKAARDTAARLHRLVQKKLASPEDAENARSLAEAAAATVKASQESLALLVIGPRKEDIAAARAELQARQAALSLSQEYLADAVLYAPSDGVIRNRILEPGDMVTPQTPVLTLALNNPVWVRAYLPEPMLGRIAPGMTAQIRTDSYPDKVYRGWVGYISPTAEFTPKNVETPELRTRLVYQVRIYACNPQNELRLGMPATVSIPFAQPHPLKTGTTRKACGE